MNQELLVEFFVPGKPQPGGSKRPFIPRYKDGSFVRRKDGSVMVNTVESNPKANDWRASVKQFAGEAYKEPPTREPLGVAAYFYLARPKGHLNSKGQVKSSAPPCPTSKPDGTKLWRSTEDALTGVVWVDDAQIVIQNVIKLYSLDGRIGAKIEVFRLTPEKPVYTSTSEKLGAQQGGLFG